MRKPRLFILRGLPGSGKSTIAKEYQCLHVEDDTFAIKGGVYHWNDSDGSGIKALAGLHATLDFICRRKCDLVLSAVLPFCSARPSETRGHTLFRALLGAVENDYEIWCETLTTTYGNKHGCAASVYEKIFLGEDDLKKSIAECFGDDLVKDIHWERMPSGVEVRNETEE